MDQITLAVKEMVQSIRLEPMYAREPIWKVYPIPRGGWPIAQLMTSFSIPSHSVQITTNPNECLFAVDDLIDSGKTVQNFQDNYNKQVFVPIDKLHVEEDRKLGWIIFPWEGKNEGVEDNYTRILQHIGENVTREGLIDTPKRAAKAITEMTSGYKITQKMLKEKCTTFSSEGFDGEIKLEEVHFTSLCEHHILPFIGKVKVSYVPDKLIIGASKPSRIINAFAKRLQNQERLTQQVRDFFWDHVKPKSIQVQIEALHTCMVCRGVELETPNMVTTLWNPPENDE